MPEPGVDTLLEPASAINVPLNGAEPNITPLARAASVTRRTPESTLPEQRVIDDAEADEWEDDHLRMLHAYMNSNNICEFLDDTVISKIGSDAKAEFDIDENSRSDWKTKSENAMKLAMQVAEKKTYPWPNASNVLYPLMTSASIQFAARAYPAIISNKNVVKGTVVGPDKGVPSLAPIADPETGGPVINPQTGQPALQQVGWKVPPGAKAMRAAQIGEHMSWQLLSEQPEWEEETDKMLHMLPIVGCAFRKSYYDKSRGRNMSVLCSAMDVVVNNKAKSLELAPRISEIFELYPYQIKENELMDLYRPISYAVSSSAESANDPDAPQKFIEQHRLIDLDGDGYKEPYIVTFHLDTQQVVRITARFDEDGIKINARTGRIMKIIPLQFYTKYDFLPNPEGGIYGVGFGQLLFPINSAVNTTLNMMLDAGHLAVTGGGFIGKGLSMHAGNVRFIPGEYKGINVSGASIKENIVPLNFPGPSPVLFQLLGMLVEAGKEIAAVKDVLTGELSGENIAPTTILALIEQGMKVFTAIYQRIYRALKKELNKLYDLNRKYLDEETGYNIGDDWKTISRQDYLKSSGVEPVSDPRMVSDMQQLGQAQFLLVFKDDPWFNGREIRKRALEAAKTLKIDEVLLTQPPVNPEIIKDSEKLRISNVRTEAEATKDLAQGLLYLVQAEVAIGQANVPWATDYLMALRNKLEELKNATTGNGIAPAPPNPGAGQPAGSGGPPPG